MSTTPLIVDTNVETFNEYLHSLSRSSYKNYKFTLKHNGHIQYKEVPFDKGIVHEFMKLWERQLVRKSPIQWAFPVEHVEDLYNKKIMRFFGAFQEDILIALHFVEDYKGYVECHPPMYDKNIYSGQYLGKYMWFSLIKYAIEHKMGYIDLGGGDRGTWKEFVKNRHLHPKTTYKWAYISKKVKDNPDNEKSFLIGQTENNKYLYEERI